MDKPLDYRENILHTTQSHYTNSIVFIRILVFVIMFVSKLDIEVHVMMSTPLKENKINVK